MTGNIQQIIANIIDRTLDEQEATSAPLSVSEIAAAVVSELGLVEEHGKIGPPHIVRYTTPWKTCRCHVTLMPAEQFDELARTLDEPDDAPVRNLIRDGRRPPSGTIEERIAQEEARQRANPPTPGAMQGDAGPEYYREVARRVAKRATEASFDLEREDKGQHDA